MANTSSLWYRIGTKPIPSLNLAPRAGDRSGSKDEGGAPLFFVSVASKGFSCRVSLLFATLAGRAIGVADKGVSRMADEQEGYPLRREEKSAEEIDSTRVTVRPLCR